MSQSSHHPRVSTKTERHAAGQHITSHWHDDDQLIYVSSGLMAIHTDAGAWVAAPHRAVLVPAGARHEHRVFGHSSVHLVGFSSKRTPWPRDVPTVLVVDGLLHEVLIALTDGTLAPIEADHLRAVLVDRLRRGETAPLHLPTARDPRLRAVCDLVIADLSQTRTLASLANETNVGERTLARLFRTEFGQTYPQWRTAARLYRAMIELSSGRSVTQTAMRCGFSSTSAFVDTFRRAMGQTPGTLRATGWAGSGAVRRG